MFRYSLLVLFGILSIICYSNNVLALDSLPNNYYPYKPKYADIYIGIGYASTADISVNTGGNPEWGALYNPLKLLSTYGINFNLGIRPLEVIPFFRNFRVEGEFLYRESRYKILIDSSKNTWVNRSKLPPYGKIYLKNVSMLNVYYDIRWFNDIFYPYVGAGVGVGNLGVRHIDFTMLPSFIGEEYVGSKKNTPVTQFIAGLQYDTKILKTSVFFEYRFTISGTATTYPTYTGNESKKEDKSLLEDSPIKHTPPPPKNIGYKAHAVVFGLKYYLY